MEGVFSYKIKEFNIKNWESSYLQTGKLIENKEKSFSFNHFQNNLANTREIKDCFLLKIPQIIGDVSLYPEAILRILIVKHHQDN